MDALYIAGCGPVARGFIYVLNFVHPSLTGIYFTRGFLLGELDL